MYAHQVKRDMPVMILGLTERDRVRKAVWYSGAFQDWLDNRAQVERENTHDHYGVVIHKFKEYVRHLPKDYDDMFHVKLLNGDDALFSSHELEYGRYYAEMTSEEWEQVWHPKPKKPFNFIDWAENND